MSITPNPPVSVAMTTYNVAPFVRGALESVAAQNYAPLEVVVYDDCSSDGTANAVEEFRGRSDMDISLIRAQLNRGFAHAINEALAACSGTYVAVLDGDDVWLPGKIAAQVEWLEADKSRVLCGHDVECFDSETSEVLWTVAGVGRLTSGHGAARSIRNGPLYPTSAVMLRRPAIPRDLNPFGLRGYTDWTLWSDCLAEGGTYGYVPGLYSRYRRRPSGIVDSIGRSDRVALAFLEAGLVWLARFEAHHPEYHTACRFRRGTLLANYGKALFERGRNQEARRYLRAAIVDQRAEAWKSVGALALAASPGGSGRVLYRLADRLRLAARGLRQRRFVATNRHQPR